MALTKVQIGMTDAPTSGAAVTASGTSVDFTGIPSTAKRITVMFSGVSTNGTSILLVQLGTSGGVETSSYLGCAVFADSSQTGTNFSAGFIPENSPNAASIRHGSIELKNISGNIWSEIGNVARSDAATLTVSAGTKTLSGTLDRVRITTVNGTDTFDAGTINIMWE